MSRPIRKKKQLFAYAKNKIVDQLCVFTTQKHVVQSFFFLNLKFLASSHVLSLHRQIYVLDLVGNNEAPFSRVTAHINQRTNGPVNAHLKPEICTNKLV